MAAQLAAQRAQREAIQASVRQVSFMCPKDQQAAPSCRMATSFGSGACFSSSAGQCHLPMFVCYKCALALYQQTLDY